MTRPSVLIDGDVKYCIFNYSVNCLDVTEDSSLMGAGFADSSVRVWSVTEKKLRLMKVGKDLEGIDKEADDVLERMMDDKSSTDTKLLVGELFK